MQNQDREVLQHLHDWCSAGELPWLCVITQCVGSSPRPVGSLLACLDSGAQSGSISGGCVEEALLEKLRAGELTSALPQFLEYGLSAQENERLGLPCGGRITLLIQRLGPNDLDWLSQVLSTLDQRRCSIRKLAITTGTTSLEAIEQFSELSVTPTELKHCFGPQMRMLLVGAGQLAQSLSELALAMNYEVIITDPRQDVIDQWEGPSVPLIQGMPDDVVRAYAADEHAVIITLTHDPRIDDMALMEALTTSAFYIGALGSLRTTQKRLERLAELGLSREQIDKLHAPVGISIGSKTPIEIAVAIMAQLVQLRSAQRLQQNNQ